MDDPSPVTQQGRPPDSQVDSPVDSQVHPQADPLAAFDALPSWSRTDGDGLTVRGRRREPAKPSVPDVHWLSGNGFCAGVYAPFLMRLPAEWGLMTHDMAGHGASDPVARFDGVPKTLDRVRAALQAQPRPPRVLMGHSFGAALSLRLAVQQPETVDALVLLDPIMLPRWFWASTKLAAAVGRHPFAQASRRRRAHWPDTASARAHLAGRGIYAGWRDEAMDAFIAYATRDGEQGRQLCCAPELEAQIFENPLYLWGDIRRLAVPTLMAFGEGSYFFMAPSVKAAARSNARITPKPLPGGHCFMLEAPERSAEVVTDWLGEQTAAAR